MIVLCAVTATWRVAPSKKRVYREFIFSSHKIPNDTDIYFNPSLSKSLGLASIFLLTSIISNNTIQSSISSSVYFKNVINLESCERGLFELFEDCSFNRPLCWSFVVKSSHQIQDKLREDREVFLRSTRWMSDNILKTSQSWCFRYICGSFGVFFLNLFCQSRSFSHSLMHKSQCKYWSVLLISMKQFNLFSCVIIQRVLRILEWFTNWILTLIIPTSLLV